MRPLRLVAYFVTRSSFIFKCARENACAKLYQPNSTKWSDIAEHLKKQTQREATKKVCEVWGKAPLDKAMYNEKELFLCSNTNCFAKYIIENKVIDAFLKNLVGQ